jgi:hypothetical protein
MSNRWAATCSSRTTVLCPCVRPVPSRAAHGPDQVNHASVSPGRDIIGFRMHGQDGHRPARQHRLISAPKKQKKPPMIKFTIFHPMLREPQPRPVHGIPFRGMPPKQPRAPFMSLPVVQEHARRYLSSTRWTSRYPARPPQRSTASPNSGSTMSSRSRRSSLRRPISRCSVRTRPSFLSLERN